MRHFSRLESAVGALALKLLEGPSLGCCSVRMRCHRSQRSTRTGDEQTRENACAARRTSPPPARAKAPAFESRLPLPSELQPASNNMAMFDKTAMLDKMATLNEQIPHASPSVEQALSAC